MTVSGSDWIELTLGSLIPDLDPDDPDSAANRLVKNIKDISDDISSSIGKVENLTSSVSNAVRRVGEIGQELETLQNSIDELVGNAANTGVFFHVLGLNPIFSATQPTDIINELRSIFFVETEDPNRPQFVGETAAVGGILLLVIAPSINEMIDSITRLGVIFPNFREAVSTFQAAAEPIPDLISNSADALRGDINDVGVDFASLGQFINGRIFNPAAFTDLFAQQGVEAAGSLLDQDPNTENFDTWFALRVTDLIPALDPTLEGSPAKALIDAERSLFGGASALLQQANVFAAGIDQLTRTVNSANVELQSLASSVTDLVESLSQTGLFIHTIGLDGSISNNEEFVDACGRALLDLDDPNRPRATGQMSAFAGGVILFGAPNPAGLTQQFDSLGAVFQGMGTDIKKIGTAARF